MLEDSSLQYENIRPINYRIPPQSNSYNSSFPATLQEGTEKELPNQGGRLEAMESGQFDTLIELNCSNLDE